jgi:hypothetical protein
MLKLQLSQLLTLILCTVSGLNSAMAEKVPSFVATSPALNEECNGQVKPDTFLSHFPIVFPLKNQRRLIA